MFFGADASRRKFGAHHRPEIYSSRMPAVLLCSPFGEEGVRIHRSFRLLAERLARAGAHVLRFDYYGAGDSAGEDEEVSLSTMAADIAEAHHELLDMSGAARAVWIGVRLGATAALTAASSAKQRGLAGMILWDPVFDGPGHLEELKALQLNYLADAYDQPPATIQRRLDPLASDEALGFALCDQFLDDMKSLDFHNLHMRPARSIQMVSARDHLAASTSEALLQSGAKVTQQDYQDATSWNSDKAMNAYIVPVKTIDGIIESVSSWR